MHAFDGVLHRPRVTDGIAAGVEGDHGRETDGDGRRGDDGDVPRAHAGGLLGGENDVAVVGQHHDLFGAQGLHRLEQLRGAWVHRLAAVDHGMAAELAEQRLVALAGDHGHHDRAFCEPGLVLQALIASPGLRVHVVDLDLVDGAQLESFAEDDPGVVGVHVDLDHVLVADHEGAVADGRQERLERGLVDGLSGDEQAGAVAVHGELRRCGGRRRLRGAAPLPRAQGDPRQRDGDVGVHEFGDAGREAAEEHEKPVPAGVDDAGLLQGRQLLGRLLDRHSAGLLDRHEQLVEAQRVGHALRRLRHLADHGEHGALDGLLDGAIGAGGAFGESFFEIGRGEVCGAAPHVTEAADDLRQDDARVAARAHERALGDGGGYGRDAFDVALLELFEDGAHGERQVGARVAVRHRIHVEVVDDAALRLDGGEGGADDRDGGEPDAQSCRSSTRTLISPSGTPPTSPTW